MTLNPAENETVFDLAIVEVPPAPEPPIVEAVPSEPNVSMMALETTRRSKTKDRDRNDD